jgi:hypothetical protein
MLRKYIIEDSVGFYSSFSVCPSTVAWLANYSTDSGKLSFRIRWHFPSLFMHNFLILGYYDILDHVPLVRQCCVIVSGALEQHLSPLYILSERDRKLEMCKGATFLCEKCLKSELYF